MTIRKLLGRIRNNLLLDAIKTAFFSIKYAEGPESGFLVYPKCDVRISSKAKIEIDSCKFRLGASWCKTRKRIRTTRLVVESGGKLKVGGDFRIYEGSDVYVGQGAALNLKGFSYINSSSKIRCASCIEIGVDCGIAEGVIIQDSDIHCIIEDGQYKGNTKPIIIGDHVWIGMNAMILKGVTIGDGSVVAAGSIVTRDVPPGTLVAGVPAKVVKTDIRWAWTPEDANKIVAQ